MHKKIKCSVECGNILLLFFSRKAKGHVPTVSFVEQEARPPCAHRQKTWNQLVVRRLCCPHGTGTGAWRLAPVRAPRLGARRPRVRRPRPRRQARCVPSPHGRLASHPAPTQGKLHLGPPRSRRPECNKLFFMRPSVSRWPDGPGP